jgi:hypothetical protein
MMEDAMLQSSLFLRRVLLADAAVSGATGAMMALGGGLIAPLAGVPQTLLLGAGVSLIPYAVLVAVLASRATLPRPAVWAVIAYNALWAVDSLVLLRTGWIAPTLLGEAFVIFQAAVVGLFAALQYLGLRRSPAMAG